LRGEVKFANREELIDQLAKDEQQSRLFLKDNQ
jgi:riboflavin kinase/FMN adenylyltransferase